MKAPAGAEEPHAWFNGRGSPPWEPCRAGGPGAEGGGWLLGAQSQDNTASCLRAIFIRPLSCLQHSSASCLAVAPDPMGDKHSPDPWPSL